MVVDEAIPEEYSFLTAPLHLEAEGKVESALEKFRRQGMHQASKPLPPSRPPICLAALATTRELPVSYINC